MSKTPANPTAGAQPKFRQIIGGILMTPLLIFMVLMTSDKETMGPHRSTLLGRLWGWAMVGVLIG